MNDELLDMLKKMNSNLKDISSNLSWLNDTLSRLADNSDSIDDHLMNIEIILEKHLREIDKTLYMKLEAIQESIAYK
jgi:hypothetical protein